MLWAYFTHLTKKEVIKSSLLEEEQKNIPRSVHKEERSN